MQIQVEVIPLHLELKKSLYLKDQAFHHRRGWHLRTEVLGKTIDGEVLPFFFDDKAKLGAIREELYSINSLQLTAEFSVSEILNSIDEVCKIPINRYGLGMLLLQCLAHVKGISLLHLFNPEASAVKLHCNRLISKNELNIKHLPETDIQTLKIKLDAGNYKEILEKLKLANDQRFNWRLDLNRSLTLNQLEGLANDTKSLNVDYIEEPLIDMNEIAKARLPFSIALDESLYLKDVSDLVLSHESIKAFVLKPAFLGSITNSLKLIRYALQNQRRIIISNIYESSLGIYFLSNLAQAFAGTEVCGLGTQDLYKNDFQVYQNLNSKVFNR